MRPRRLRELILLMCVLNLSGFVFIDSNEIPAEVAVPLFALIMIVSFVVLWYLWQGRNWARWLVLLTSLLALLNLVGMRSATLPQRALILAEAALGIYLLYWLNTAAVRGYFIKPRVSGAS